MTLIYAQEDLSAISGKSIFLAGPTPREASVPSWRPEMIEAFNKAGFHGTILIPEMRNGWDSDFEYANQINWETRALNQANVITFWIPRDTDKMKMPAFTTNFELGEWLSKEPKKIALGWPNWAEKMNYIEHRAREAFVPIFDNIEDLVDETMFKVKYRP